MIGLLLNIIFRSHDLINHVISLLKRIKLQLYYTRCKTGRSWKTGFAIWANLKKRLVATFVYISRFVLYIASQLLDRACYEGSF